jgi:hypothetical protein
MSYTKKILEISMAENRLLLTLLLPLFLFSLSCFSSDHDDIDRAGFNLAMKAIVGFLNYNKKPNADITIDDFYCDENSIDIDQVLSCRYRIIKNYSKNYSLDRKTTKNLGLNIAWVLIYVNASYIYNYIYNYIYSAGEHEFTAVDTFIDATLLPVMLWLLVSDLCRDLQEQEEKRLKAEIVFKAKDYLKAVLDPKMMIDKSKISPENVVLLKQEFLQGLH